MAKKTKAPPPEAPSKPAPKIGALLTVLLSAFALSLLALYQWMELLVAEAGGSLSCSLSASLDCAPVWSSDFAKSISSSTGMPIAAWGLVYGLACTAAAVWTWTTLIKQRDLTRAVNVLRFFAAAGLASVVVLLIVSFGVGVLCPTCLVTYVLTAIFAGGAFALPGPKVPPADQLLRAVGTGAALVVVFYVLLLFPAKNVQPAQSKELPAVNLQSSKDAGAAQRPIAPGAHEGPVADLLRSTDPMTKQMIANELANFRDSAAHPPRGDARFIWGSPGATMKMVEWTDIKCGHCAQFSVGLKQLKQNIPAEVLSVEPRQFPLDKECNTAVPQSDGQGTRCAAARALICLEGKEDFWTVQNQMFAEQGQLNRARVIELAAPAAGGKAALEKCMSSAETEKKLQDDISYAMASGIRGTPLVLINGREAAPIPHFLYALILAGGNADHPAFSVLPEPRMTGHEGHQH